MSETIWCPLVYQQPCMGRMCACAVFKVSAIEENRIDYFCGLASKLPTGACTVIDHMAMDEFEEAQS